MDWLKLTKYYPMLIVAVVSYSALVMLILEQPITFFFPAFLFISAHLGIVSAGFELSMIFAGIVKGKEYITQSLVRAINYIGITVCFTIILTVLDKARDL